MGVILTTDVFFCAGFSVTDEPSGSRNLRNPIGNPKPSKLSEPIKNHPELQNLRNVEPPSERGTCQNPSKHIETWNHLRFPEPGSFPEPPQLAQNTPKSILCKDPIAFCCWGKKYAPFKMGVKKMLQTTT